MTKLFTKFKKTAIALGTAIMAAAGIVAAPAANAAPGGTIVTLGDSYAANPDQIQGLLHGTPLANKAYPRKEGCLQAPDSWPSQLRNRGYNIRDWSCNGQTSKRALHRLDRAIATGDLNYATRAVILPAGINNYGKAGRNDGNNIFNHRQIRVDYLADMRAAATKIRSVAPNAQLIVPGMLSATNPRTGNFCAINILPNMPGPVPVGIVRDTENRLRDNQREAARQIGATFIDIKAGSAAHHSCAPDRQRWVAGVIDFTTPNYNMILHPSRAGSTYVANRIAGVL